MKSLTIAGLLACTAAPLTAQDRIRGFPSEKDLRGQVAPDFNLPLFGPGTRDGLAGVISSDSLRLSSLRGNVVVLNFWFTGCSPCVAENPTFDRLARRLASDRVKFVGVVFKESVATIAAYLERTPLTYPQVFERGSKVATAYAVAGAPFTFVIDENGVVRDQLLGGPLEEEQLLEMIAAARAKSRERPANLTVRPSVQIVQQRGRAGRGPMARFVARAP